MGLAEPAERGELDDGVDVAFEQRGQHDHVQRGCLAQARADLDVVRGNIGKQNARFLIGALSDQTLAEAELIGQMLAIVEGVACGQIENGVSVLVLIGDVEHAVLRVHQRGKFGQHHVRHGGQVAFALQHAREPGEVGLKPVLLGVLQRLILQIPDHLVDVVLQRGHFARGLHGDGPSQVALGHGGGHFGDGAHLVGQVRGELVHVVGQVAPQAGGARHAGLAAELAFDTHFAGHVRHLVGEGGQRIDHVIDGVGERGDFAFRLHGQFAAEVALRHRSHDVGDAAHLVRQVGGHHVHVVGQVLPGARDARHVGLTAETPFGAHFAGHAGHFRGK